MPRRSQGLNLRRFALSRRRPFRELISAVGNRVMEVSEQLLGEELDAKVSRIELPRNEVGHDPFGFDPATARYGLAFAAFLHRGYFRTEVFNIDRVPKGRAIVVGNHSGQIPIDALIVTTALLLDAEPPRFARSMVERWTATLPFISYLYPRFGQVVGTQDNARRLLEQESTLLVFPEGVKGISKTYRERYQMKEFGNGFVRMALETDTPIVPVAVIGGEEQYPSVANLERLAKMTGMPALPVLPQLAVGMALPLPTRYRIYFGEPMRFVGHPDDDNTAVEEKVARVRGAIQTMLDEGLRTRESVFW